VRPELARRRRRFFATVGTVLLGLLVLVVAPFLHDSDAATPGQRAVQPQGCSLLVGGSPVRLDSALAMTLTDIAGRDQNAGASVQHTAAQVATAWPAQALDAAAVATALRGYVPAALACTATLPAATRQPIQANGLTARANAMWDAIKRIFGPLPAGGFMPGGVQSGHVPGSAHYEGRAIDFLYRPITAKSIQHGWVLAQWAEAHAVAMQIATVIFDARIWTPGDWSSRSWRPYVYPDGTTTNPTLMHDDHVHLDVQRGT
jgi:hypothetical protein